MGNQACNPSPNTVDCLYDAASHAGLLPDLSLDASLASLLSLNSSRVVEQQYAALQSRLAPQQRAAFNRDLHTAFGGNAMVSYGGVGVVALAVSVLFEVLAHHQTTTSGHRGLERPPTPPDPIARMFGPNGRSEVGSIASEFLKQVPGAANDRDQMVALLESYEAKLRFELMDLYESMVFLERGALSSAGVKQWVNGAALHLHIFLHWKRLTDPAAAESFSLDYLRGVDPLVKTYSEYLHRTVRETPASGPGLSGLLVVEPLRNVSHEVRHRACESAAIQRALVERFLSDQDPQRGKDFFQSSQDRHDALMAQRGDLRLSIASH
ncbi:uncharacterized protein LOC115363532 [Myripristis murdjan]|uniref:uncharacterized protein LOC115363532 n=1 Tax=Myripristis murdjan TaxID=586833 RepID=UPI001175D405|nr:uncharacterized protein LOC115363532 [Myripristis murdjan]